MEMTLLHVVITAIGSVLGLLWAWDEINFNLFHYSFVEKIAVYAIYCVIGVVLGFLIYYLLIFILLLILIVFIVSVVRGEKPNITISKH